MSSPFRPPAVTAAIAGFLTLQWWVGRHVPGLWIVALVATAALKRRQAHCVRLCVTLVALYVLLNHPGR
jgi:hypothetical protein